MGPERGQGPREAEGAPRAGAWGRAVPLEVEERAWGSGAFGAPAHGGSLAVQVRRPDNALRGDWPMEAQ